MKNQKQKLSVSELTKIFPHPSKVGTKYPLFAGASFEITNEQISFLLGISGSGKTTLFRILSSLEPINAGEIYLNELAIHLLKEKEKINYLKSLGFLDQFSANNLSLTLSVRQNLDYTLILYTNFVREERLKRIIEILKYVSLNSLLEKNAIYLSGGELRRLALACSLIHEPTLLLCDEPTSQLDKENKLQVLQAIKELHSAIGSLIFIATHDSSIIGNNPCFKIIERRIQKCQ